MKSRFIEITDRYGRTNILNVADISDVIDYGSYVRVYMTGGRYYYFNVDISVFKWLLKNETGPIRKIN